MDILHPSDWPRPPGFSSGTAAEGKHVFISGQVGTDPVSRELAPDFAGQCHQALSNIMAILAEGGAGPEHIVKMTWFVASIAAYREAGRGLGEAWKATMGRNFPAMTLVEVTGLLAENAMVENEAHAIIA